MNVNITLVFSVLLFAVILTPAYAASTDHIVINEVEINPPGDDSQSASEWVEVYNPTDSDVDLSGWSIASTTGLKKTMMIPTEVVIKSDQLLRFSYEPSWFTDANELVELRDKNNIVIDKTPLILDKQNDFTSWQRLYDGYDFDSSDDWKFVTSTSGYSNGKLVTTQDSKEITVTVSSNKDSYVFGETATISGSVSEQVFIVKPFFQPQQITMTISGPNFYKTITLYPDLNLNYKTTVKLDKVLGINDGRYDVSVNYAGESTTYANTFANTSFSVGLESVATAVKTDASLSILTDNSQYIPGQLVSITGYTSKVIPYEGMKLIVKDPLGKTISDGVLYPTDAKFKTTVYISTVNPVYGTYEIIAEYFDKSALIFFDVSKDVKEDTPISLWTDKVAYGLGDVVKITGRINQEWSTTLNLEILQTTQSSIKSSSTGTASGFKTTDGVRILGDGSFTYTFTILDNETRLGDYRISVSESIGTVSRIIHVVSNPDDFITSDAPLTVYSDKDVYEIGDKITLSGIVKDPFSNSSYTTGTPVNISISHEDGTPLEIIGLLKESKGGSRNIDNVVVQYDFTSIPEISGAYSISVDATKTVFTEGKYVVTSQYLDHVVTSTFSIISDIPDLKDGALISINKDVYGLGETVHLTGILPPTADNSITISITKPDGTRIDSGTKVDNQRFSWSWITPINEKVQSVKIDDGKTVTKSNFGIYKIHISIQSYSKDLFFKVSLDPENDSISTTPIFVSTEKSIYKAGEKLKVTGNVIKNIQGDVAVVPTRVTIKVLDGIFPFKQIFESSVYPKQGGEFTSFFELPATIFVGGSYKVKASYLSTLDETIFSVADDFAFGLDDDLTLLLNVDKSEYYPGDIVEIFGKPNKLIYLEKFDVRVIKKTDSNITCGTFVCGTTSVADATIRPSPSGSFNYQFMIPDNVSSIGSYKVTIDAGFEAKSIQFMVTEKPPTLKLTTVIEKENRISEKTISIFTGEKSTSDGNFMPRVLSGSMITPTIADTSTVNLKVSTVSGVCIIGSDADCLVKESTRKQGQIYDVVEVDGISLNVRYSGPDVRLEKFSILPESPTAFLPDTNWNVDVIKDDQVSRFYYKVTYKTLE